MTSSRRWGGASVTAAVAAGATLIGVAMIAAAAHAGPPPVSRSGALGVAPSGTPAGTIHGTIGVTTLYDNLGTSTTYYAGQGGNEPLDDLHLTAGGSLDLLEFECFDSAVGDAYSATVTIYGNPSGLDLAYSPVLGTYQVSGIPRGRQRVSVPLPDAPVVGAHVWVGVRFSSSTAGLIVQSQPSIGSSHDLYVENDGFYDFGGNPKANFALRLVDRAGFVLTTLVSGQGSVTRSPDAPAYTAGTTVHLTAVPAAHWHVVGWSGDASSTADTVSIVMDEEKTVTATFAIDTYTLTYVAGPNGSITGTTPQTVDHGANGTTVTAVADAGHHFVSWSDGVTTAARTDQNVTADLGVTATFAIDTYTLTYLAGPNGAISGTTPQTVAHGANGTTVTAVANAGHHFVRWSDDVTTAGRTDLNVTADLTVTATFAINTYTLTYASGPNGSISGTTPQTVSHGANGTTVTAVADGGHHFVSWSDGVTTAARTELNVTANLSVTATFARDDLACNGGFEIDLAGWIKRDNADLTRVTPGRLSAWAMQIKSKSSSDCGADDSPDCIQGAALGARYRFTAWVKAGSSSSLDRKVKLRVYESGSSSYVSTEVRLGTAWQKLTLDYVVKRRGSSLSERFVYDPNNSNEFFFVDDVGIELVPPPSTFTITATAGAGGSIAPPNVSTVTQGDSKTFTITPAAGYRVQDVVVDPGVSVGAVPGYTFANVQSNRTIHASFVVVQPGENLVANPSFESGIHNWAAYEDATLSWHTAGRTGVRSLMVTGDEGSNGIDDQPNWVQRVVGVGARYRFKAWVKAANASSTGKARIKIYEQNGNSQVGSTVSSPESTLTTARWKLLTVDYVVRQANTTLSMRVSTSADDQTFLVDDVSIEWVGSPAPMARLSSDPDAAPVLEYARPTVYPNPTRGAATLALSLARPGALRVELYDVTGRRIRVLADETQAAAGTHRFALDRRATNSGAGIYFYRADIDGVRYRGRFVVLE